MFPRFILASKFERRCQEGGGSVPYTFITFSEGFAGDLEESELGVVIGALHEMDQSSQPALFYDRFFSLGSSSLGGYTRIACWCLHSFSYENSEDFYDSFEVL